MLHCQSSRRTGDSDQINPESNQLLGEPWEIVGFGVSPSRLQDDVLPFDVAEVS
jgi:hypothetical protein